MAYVQIPASPRNCGKPLLELFSWSTQTQTQAGERPTPPPFSFLLCSGRRIHIPRMFHSPPRSRCGDLVWHTPAGPSVSALRKLLTLSPTLPSPVTREQTATIRTRRGWSVCLGMRGCVLLGLGRIRGDGGMNVHMCKRAPLDPHSRNLVRVQLTNPPSPPTSLASPSGCAMTPR
jgi:hypothetical protein